MTANLPPPPPPPHTSRGITSPHRSLHGWREGGASSNRTLEAAPDGGGREGSVESRNGCMISRPSQMSFFFCSRCSLCVLLTPGEIKPSSASTKPCMRSGRPLMWWLPLFYRAYFAVRTACHLAPRLAGGLNCGGKKNKNPFLFAYARFSRLLYFTVGSCYYLPALSVFLFFFSP